MPFQQGYKELHIVSTEVQSQNIVFLPHSLHPAKSITNMTLVTPDIIHHSLFLFQSNFIKTFLQSSSF